MVSYVDELMVVSSKMLVCISKQSEHAGELMSKDMLARSKHPPRPCPTQGTWVWVSSTTLVRCVKAQCFDTWLWHSAPT